MSIRGLFVGRVSAFALLGTILGMLLAPITASFGEDAIAYCGGFGGKVFGFEIVGDRAYVVEGGALAIYDLSNPSSFLLLGRVLLPEANLTHSAFARIKISGDRVYAGFINSEYLSSKANSFSIHAIDISTPATPVWLGSYKPEHAIGDFAVSGNYVFFEDKADSWTEYRLVSLDMTQPATPAIAGTLPVAPLFTVFWIEGATLNAIAGCSYLASFDITTPTAPTLITQNQISPTTELFPNNAVKESTTLYVASSNFLDGENYFCIYDISVPSSPVVLSETLLPNSHGISDVAVAGQVAYVLSKEVYVSPEDTYKLFMYKIGRAHV